MSPDSRSACQPHNPRKLSIGASLPDWWLAMQEYSDLSIRPILSFGLRPRNPLSFPFSLQTDCYGMVEIREGQMGAGQYGLGTRNPTSCFSP